MLKGKKILIGITGSIAAYKSILLVRLFIKEGAEVKVVMTPAATDFVSPLVLSTLSKNEVTIDLFKGSDWSNHVHLGRWADVMLIAPLSCNTMAKMANGLCDNMLLAVYLSATCPVVLAPAMDEDMWKHASTKQNIQTLTSRRHELIPVDNGELASGLTGEGRMAEPEFIVEQVKHFFLKQLDFKNVPVLVTSGPTYEAIDPVRFIGNHSSGKMGFELAKELIDRGANVTMVTGPTHEPIATLNAKVVSVKSAREMYDACMQHFDQSAVIIMAAAVADYTPAIPNDRKIKKKENSFSIELIPTADILKTMGSLKKENQLLVGFALETNNEAENARKKLKSKNADMIVLNSASEEGAGFGGETNKITIFEKDGEETTFPVKTKAEVAKDIVNSIKKMMHV